MGFNVNGVVFGGKNVFSHSVVLGIVLEFKKHADHQGADLLAMKIPHVKNAKPNTISVNS